MNGLLLLPKYLKQYNPCIRGNKDKIVSFISFIFLFVYIARKIGTSCVFVATNIISMQTIYVFSGLGADERVFYKIDFGSYNTVFIKWITPRKNEFIEDYALRLTTQIITKNPILIGLSFGGMMAVEVAKHIATEKLILLSSAKNKNEIPYYFRMAGMLGIHKIIPASLLIKANMFTNWFFSSRTKAEKKMLSAILHDTDPVFLKWAIAKIATWQNMYIHKNLLHLHGTADRILPIKNVTANESITGGAHLMVVTNAEEVSAILVKLLNSKI